MAQIKADRVKETTETTGTGNIALAGAALGYRAFSSVMSANDTCYYVLAHKSNGEWETGYGTLLNATTFARSSVTASSNGNTWVNFSAGTKELSLALTASQLGQIPEADRGYPLKLTFDSTGVPFAKKQNAFVYGSNVASALSLSSSGVLVGDSLADNCLRVSGAILIGSNILNGSSSLGSPITRTIAIGGSTANTMPDEDTSFFDNVIIGHQAGTALGVGSASIISNILLGSICLPDASKIAYVTAIGYTAGKSLVDGDSCVYIGSECSAKDATETNAIVIGAFAVGKGSNTTVIGTSNTTEAWIYGKLIPSGAIQPASLSNAAAPNNSIYYSTTAGKLVFKDSTGTVNNLY